MRLIKYDGVSDKSIKAILANGGGSSSNNNSDLSSRAGSDLELDRTIWGQKDEGDDIDGSMVVNGNISINCIIPPSYDEEVDDSDDGEDEEVEEGGGNLNVELKITSNEVESNDIYAKSHLYIPHPSTKAKTDIVELLKGYDSRITNNTTNIAANKAEIDALKGRVSSAETNITNIITHQESQDVMINANVQEILQLKGKTSTNETNITNLYEIVGGTEGEGLLTEERVLELIKANAPTADVNAPVVLFSGTIYSDNNDGDKTWRTWFTRETDSSYHSGLFYLSMNYAEKDSIPALQIELKPKSGWSVKPTSVNAMVTKTHNYNVSTSQKGGNPRSSGYWMTGGVIDNKVYLGAWRTQDDNNDSVRFDVLPYRCQEINLTIYGKIYKTE